jgi:hypothetical protein
MKHRGSSKIKYEHQMINGLREVLEAIAGWEEVKSIIPAVINRRKGASSGGIQLKVQYPTKDGLKCLAHGIGVVQEVFIVTPCPEKVAERLKGEKPKLER